MKGNSFSGCALLQDRPVVNDAKETQGEPCMVGARGEGKRNKGRNCATNRAREVGIRGRGTEEGGASRVGGVDGGVRE